MKSPLYAIAAMVLLATAATLAPSIPRALADTPAPTEAPWRAKIRAFAVNLLKHPAWGYSHSERDYALGTELAKRDHVALDDDVMFAAAYLHDIAGFAPYANPSLDHSDVGAEDAGPILKDAGFPMEKLAGVQSAIRTHMFYRDPVEPEARYLHDADALDWLGAIGVARIIATVDHDGGKPTGPDAVAALQSNLAKVPDRIVTPAGRAMMPALRDELATFLKELSSETDGYKHL